MAQLELEPGSGSSSGSWSGGVLGAIIGSTAGNVARSGRSAVSSATNAAGSARGGAAAAFASCCIRLCRSSCCCIRQYSAVKDRASVNLSAAFANISAAPSSAMAADDDELDEHDCGGRQMGHWTATVPRGRWAGACGRTAGCTGGGGWTGGAFGSATVVVEPWWEALLHAKPI